MPRNPTAVDLTQYLRKKNSPLADHVADIMRSANRWRIATDGNNDVVLSYELVCRGRSVTTNEVTADYAVFNGPATFVKLGQP